MVAQRREPRRADAAHLVELGDRAKAAVLRAVVDDALAERGADPVERLELLERRRVERDRCRRMPRRRHRRPAVDRRPRRGTTICSPSVNRAARLSASRSARLPARALRTASSTLAPVGSRYTPARRTSPLTSMTRTCGSGLGASTGSEAGVRLISAASPSTGPVPPTDREDEDDGGGVEGELARRREHGAPSSPPWVSRFQSRPAPIPRRGSTRDRDGYAMPRSRHESEAIRPQPLVAERARPTLEV